MHNKYATFVLPVLAGLAIVGAGFSTWVFGQENNDASANATGTVQITDADDKLGATIELGTVSGTDFTKGPETFTLQLDQGGYSYLTDKTVGISVIEGLQSFDLKWSTTNTDFLTVYDGYTLTLTLTATVEYSGNTETYIKWAPGSSASQSVAIAIDNETVELVQGDGTLYYLWDTNIENDWEYANKPSEFGAYSSMVADLSGSDDKVTLNVTVKASLAPTAGE